MSLSAPARWNARCCEFDSLPRQTSFSFFLFSFMGILHHIYLILMTAVDGLSMSLLSSMANISALTRVSFFGVYVCAYDAHLLDR